MGKLAIVTCLELPEPDVDEAMLMTALDEAGIDASLAAWDDPQVAWETFDLAVIRSTWDYPERPLAFRHWIERTSALTELLNPPETLLVNMHKSYLSALQAKGVEVVPTQWFSEGWTGGLDAVPWPDVVIKPCISAGSWLTERFASVSRQDAVRFLHERCAERDMMVQPYLTSVERGGEIAWIWIDGEVTHGVSKAPRFAEGFESVSEMIQPNDEVRNRVEKIIQSVDADLLYARIDLMQDGEKWLLSELELIEPSLFLRQNPRALDRLVKSIQARLSRIVARG